ncbi:fumarylacetoacetate hydrolase family protein [Pseudonocardia sp. RS11V-5]|uniref:fumarylacetoacetate hydrolase family protein n=1 Tax=Pseudonocardia terrae TaxID=2905831 RepID=UPI001E3F1131|nr:fumarylacetoacetate hydrolase family protein [Pseudonocardia terrae]MCE3555795.1 fumarylacetoacetate hydrolase family protein [Pseudonocardia terrae]
MTRIARFRHAGRNKFGVLDGDSFVDATRAYAAAQQAKGVPHADALADVVLPPDLLVFFESGDTGTAALQEAVAYAAALDPEVARREGIRVDRSEATVAVPIPRPPKIVCVARNYAKHAAEANLQISEIPILFPRFGATQIADGEAIIVPTVSKEVDWEGELAVVIGKGGRHIRKEDAFAHVGGYTIFNDVSVRDYQFRVTQYTGGKNFHASAPVGPHITLADEGLNPHNLRITTTVNGVVKQDATTAEFIFDIPTLIEHISEFIELEPGDIIPTGTPAGVGFKRQPPEFLADGDVVEVSVEGIGTLTNPVRNEE